MGSLEESLELFYEFQDDCVEEDAVTLSSVNEFVGSLDDQQVRDVSSLFQLCGWAVYPPATLVAPLTAAILCSIEQAIYDAFWFEEDDDLLVDYYDEYYGEEDDEEED
tara:strand:- start:123 stop:446 length:324 start_codon:yes stop_codon:yes gene_type:complete